MDFAEHVSEARGRERFGRHRDGAVVPVTASLATAWQTHPRQRTCADQDRRRHDSPPQWHHDDGPADYESDNNLTVVGHEQMRQVGRYIAEHPSIAS